MVISIVFFNTWLIGATFSSIPENKATTTVVYVVSMCFFLAALSFFSKKYQFIRTFVFHDKATLFDINKYGLGIALFCIGLSFIFLLCI
ncbi:hypothetical protein VN23_06500 [Janthinobacterium sp. B9-8]|nr:hypothetical protein VN23_06500 [Janthinobacterium sp. B9-8]